MNIFYGLENILQSNVCNTGTIIIIIIIELLIFFWVLNRVHLLWTSLFFQFPICFMLVHSSKIVPLPGAPLREIHHTQI